MVAVSDFRNNCRPSSRETRAQIHLRMGTITHPDLMPVASWSRTSNDFFLAARRGIASRTPRKAREVAFATSD
jgi:hypothetical protein